ncbi:hypothetical protein D3C72_926160 [compost metagenome]
MTGVLGFILGLVAVFAAIKRRKALVEPLGPGWFVRFLAIQAGLINGALLALILVIAQQLAWTGPTAAWLVPIGYAVGFYFYSLSNIDWTVKKFHSQGGA